MTILLRHSSSRRDRFRQTAVICGYEIGPESGRSAILLVPEIGLTPAVTADVHAVSATKWQFFTLRSLTRNALNTGAFVAGNPRDVGTHLQCSLRSRTRRSSSWMKNRIPPTNRRNARYTLATSRHAGKDFSDAVVVLGLTPSALESY
jgi:hypothetical protein